ncbi:xylan 1,4-beta-xylosidase [Alicyclobacillaceae bacterium I2511]|nr:xylan 1,4-beta-xylosidase [Alicyclobacillaceae bacterium I2511]
MKDFAVESKKVNPASISDGEWLSVDKHSLGREVLSAPTGLWAKAGLGHVTLGWDPVSGASGYVLLRRIASEEEFVEVDHHGGDVKAFPGNAYTDTTGELGQKYQYAVAAVAAPEGPRGQLSSSVVAASRWQGDAEIRLSVDVSHTKGPIRPIWRMIGSEHLSQMFSREMVGGQLVGEDFLHALVLAKEQLGVQRVRAHGIFLDELQVYSLNAGKSAVNFKTIDDIYDRLLKLGLKPVVELSFMPKDLAANPNPTVFHYQAHISPPSSWIRWGELVKTFVQHLVSRYGVEEVCQWGFEVWNEPNLAVFWTASQAEYFQMYEVTARAVKEVDARLWVGGPATAASGWVPEFLQYVKDHELPLDFLATHTYGNMPLNFRTMLIQAGLAQTEVWWTEWGVTPTHFAPVNDSAYGAPFVLHGLKQAQHSVDFLAYWVVSDQFEELGRGSKLFHGGFGLLTVGGLRKPRFWAIRLAEEMGPTEVASELAGDGAGTLVDAWATRHDDGMIDVLVWNGTMNQYQQTGYPWLDRTVNVQLSHLKPGAYRVTLARVDRGHSNIIRAWNEAKDWPNELEWQQLSAMDHLDEVTIHSHWVLGQDTFQFAFDLPMPGVARLRLEPIEGVIDFR